MITTIAFSCFARTGRRAAALAMALAVALCVGTGVGERYANAREYMATYEPWRPAVRRQRDRRPPTRPQMALVRLMRGSNPSSSSTVVVHRVGMPDSTDVIESRSSGGHMGALLVSLSSTDDRTPQDSLGWRVRVVSGQLEGVPDYHFRIIPVDMTDSSANRVFFHFSDWNNGPSDCCRPIRAGLIATCIDKAGNESKPSDTLWVVSEGR